MLYALSIALAFIYYMIMYVVCIVYCAGVYPCNMIMYVVCIVYCAGVYLMWMLFSLKRYMYSRHTCAHWRVHIGWCEKCLYGGAIFWQGGCGLFSVLRCCFGWHDVVFFFPTYDIPNFISNLTRCSVQ